MSKTEIILTGSFKYGIYSITWNVIVNKKWPIISINVEKLFLLSHNIVDVLESLFKWLDVLDRQLTLWFNTDYRLFDARFRKSV